MVSILQEFSITRDACSLSSPRADITCAAASNKSTKGGLNEGSFRHDRSGPRRIAQPAGGMHYKSGRQEELFAQQCTVVSAGSQHIFKLDVSAACYLRKFRTPSPSVVARTTGLTFFVVGERFAFHEVRGRTAYHLRLQYITQSTHGHFPKA